MNAQNACGHIGEEADGDVPGADMEAAGDARGVAMEAAGDARGAVGAGAADQWSKIKEQWSIWAYTRP